MVLSITAFCLRIYLKKFSIPRNSCIFVLFEDGWIFWTASMQDFNGVIVFLSIICPRHFARLRKKCDLSGAAFMFSFYNF